jgi:hypothetical protein
MLRPLRNNATGLFSPLLGVALLSACQPFGGSSGSASGYADPSLTLSVVSVSAPTVVAGSSVTVNLTVNDSGGNAIPNPGLTVAFQNAGGTSAGLFSPVTYAGNGVYGATFTAGTSGSPTAVLATIGGALVTTTPSVTITVQTGPPNATNCTITGTGPISANGVASSTVTIHLADIAANPVAGIVPTFSATNTGSGNTYGTCAATDATGKSTCTLTTTWPETKTLSLVSPVSSTGGTVTANPSTASLEVPIEMVDYGISSTTSPLLFFRTYTSLNTADYDGTDSFAFEIVAYNSDTVSRNVSLVDELGATLTSIPVSSGASSLRIRSAFTPDTGIGLYRVKLDATTSNDQLRVESARLIVTQVGATKTKIYVPLVNRQTIDYAHTDNATGLDTTTSTTLTQATATYYSIWTLTAGAFGNLDATAPYTLEAVLSSSNAAGTASAALYNRTGSTAVTGAQVSASGSTTPQLVTASFTATAAGLTVGNDFDLRIESSSASYTTYLARAGLWIKLTNLYRGEVYYRADRSHGNIATSYFTDERLDLHASYFSNPTLLLEATGSNTTASAATYLLYDDGSNDTGSAGATTVTGATITFPTAKGRVRSSAFTVTDGDRFIGQFSKTAGTDAVTNALVVFQFVGN